MMNARVISTLAAACLAAGAFAAPASAQDVLQRCNGSMADVETMAKRVAECRDWSAGLHNAESALRAGTASLSKSTTVSLDVVVSTVIIPADIAKAVLAEPKLTDKLSLYYAYDGFAAGDPSRCSPLSKVMASEMQCRETFDELSFVRGRLGPRADFVKGCLRRRDMADRDISRAQLPAWCNMIADTADDPATLCAKLMPMFAGKSAHETPPSVAECRATFSSLKGDDSSCGVFPAERRANCQADALFARAYKAKNASLCGPSQRCRVLMGEGKQVAKEIAAGLTSPAAQWVLKSGWVTTIKATSPGAPSKPAPPPSSAAAAGKAPEPFKGFVCADPFWSEANRKATQSTVKAAQVCLTDIDSVVAPTVALAQGVDSRLEKLARLQLQIAASLEPAEHTPQPKKPAGAPRKAR